MFAVTVPERLNPLTYAAQSFKPQAKRTLTVDKGSMNEMAIVRFTPLSVTGLVTNDREPCIIPTDSTEPDLKVYPPGDCDGDGDGDRVVGDFDNDRVVVDCGVFDGVGVDNCDGV